jgi:hypothetical protein
MALSISNKTQDQVQAAALRTVFNNGKEWGTSGSTLATVTDISANTDLSGGTASHTIAAIAAGASYTQADMLAVKNGLASVSAKLNTVLALIRNLNA